MKSLFAVSSEPKNIASTRSSSDLSFGALPAQPGSLGPMFSAVCSSKLIFQHLPSSISRAFRRPISLFVSFCCTWGISWPRKTKVHLGPCGSMFGSLGFIHPQQNCHCACAELFGCQEFLYSHFVSLNILKPTLVYSHRLNGRQNLGPISGQQK